MTKLNIIALFSVFLLCSTLEAQTRIQVHGAGKLYPVAAPTLCADSESLISAASGVAQTIRRSLDMAGYFSVIEPNLYLEKEGKCSQNFAYSDWSIINVEGLIKGEISRAGSDVNFKFYLHDVPKQGIVLAKEYTGSEKQIAAMTFRFVNEVIGYFTGQKGVFGSKIAFSSKVGRFKELFIVEMDGSNIQQVTYDKALALSAGWSPNGQELVFTSYRNRMPDVFTYNFPQNKFSQVTKTQNLEIGGQFDSSSSRILLSLSHGRDSDLVYVDRSGKILKFITENNGAIEVSPVFSPDFQKIAFVSNRAGGPQIYTMPAEGGSGSRISFVQSNYCTSPSWSPIGDKLAYVCRADGGFQVFVSNADGTEAFQLTSGGNNEDPSWSPDGRHIVFASTYWQGGRFSLGIMRNDGSNLRQLTKSRTGDTDPAWGPVM